MLKVGTKLLCIKDGNWRGTIKGQIYEVFYEENSINKTYIVTQEYNLAFIIEEDLLTDCKSFFRIVDLSIFNELGD